MRTVVVTGGTRGLGFELAKEFRKRNYNVALCGTTQQGVGNAISRLEEMPGLGDVFGRPCNVASLAEVESLADAAIENFQTIDIWINNAGINQSFQYAWNVPEQEVDMLLSVDLKGAINGTSVAMRRMIAQGHGAIYNVEGMGSNDAFQPRFALYGTAKRAVTYFTDAVAHEIEEEGLPIKIGKLSPGIMITDFLTSAQGKLGQTELNEKTKKVYNILGDKPDVIAEYLVQGIEDNSKNGKRIEWLTKRKAAFRFMTAGLKKRNFFD